MKRSRSGDAARDFHIRHHDEGEPMTRAGNPMPGADPGALVEKDREGNPLPPRGSRPAPAERPPVQRGPQPMKLYEYAAAGLPVVYTASAELCRLGLPFAFPYRWQDVFPAAVRAAASPPPPEPPDKARR